MDRPKWPRRIGFVALGLAVLFLTAFVSWSAICPCEMSPGGYLFGPGPDTAVDDWSFANQAPICQIQVDGGMLPYSINLNCMATDDGTLYLSCSVCDRKRWAAIVLDDDEIRVRIEGTVYPVTATRVLDPAELDRIWEARVAKLQVHGTSVNPAVPVGTPRPDRWWSFHLEPR